MFYRMLPMYKIFINKKHSCHSHFEMFLHSNYFLSLEADTQIPGPPSNSENDRCSTVKIYVTAIVKGDIKLEDLQDGLYKIDTRIV